MAKGNDVEKALRVHAFEVDLAVCMAGYNTDTRRENWDDSPVLNHLQKSGEMEIMACIVGRENNAKSAYFAQNAKKCVTIRQTDWLTDRSSKIHGRRRHVYLCATTTKNDDDKCIY